MGVTFPARVADLTAAELEQLVEQAVARALDRRRRAPRRPPQDGAAPTSADRERARTALARVDQRRRRREAR